MCMKKLQKSLYIIQVAVIAMSIIDLVSQLKLKELEIYNK